jgi:hypothetical protein
MEYRLPPPEMIESMKIPWQEANEGLPDRKSSIKKDSGGEDWMELDWTRQPKSS